MIELLGLVNSGLEDMAPLAWRIYTSWEYAGQPVIHSENKTLTMAKEFKKSFSRTDVRVHFMGLWDSVNSVGFFGIECFHTPSKPPMLITSGMPLVLMKRDPSTNSSFSRQ